MVVSIPKTSVSSASTGNKLHKQLGPIISKLVAARLTLQEFIHCLQQTDVQRLQVLKKLSYICDCSAYVVYKSSY